MSKIRMVCFFGVFDHFCSIEDRARAWRARFGSFWSKWSKNVHFRSFEAFRRARQGGVCSKVVERVLKKLFRLSARSSNTHQRGLIWSAIFTPLNFREKRRLHLRGTLFYLLEKTSKSCIFTHGAPPCSEQSCNQAMFSRHPRATRGIACRISPPLPPKINVERCCNGPEPTLQH